MLRQHAREVDERAILGSMARRQAELELLASGLTFNPQRS